MSVLDRYRTNWPKVSRSVLWLLWARTTRKPSSPRATTCTSPSKREVGKAAAQLGPRSGANVTVRGWIRRPRWRSAVSGTAPDALRPGRSRRAPAERV